jgi:electron transfer flavoprotein alpha subunit
LSASPPTAASVAAAASAPVAPQDDSKDVWVYLQREGDSLSKESLELLAAGKKVADKLKQNLVGILLGHNLGEAPQMAIEYGADRLIVVDDPVLANYFSLRYVDTLSALARERKPYSFIFLATEIGKDLAPRLAYRLNTGLATDNIELEVEDYYNPQFKLLFKNLMIQIRPDFGTRVAKIYTPRHRPQMATIRPGNFKPLERDTSRKGKIEKVALADRDKLYSAIVKEMRELPKSKVNLKEAQVIISLGLGILKDREGKPRDPRQAYELALKLKEAIETKEGLKVEIGASRALIYAELKELSGLISKDNQVGQTGTTVSPTIYIALGISGALQHRVGMSKSKKIVAVNLDPNAPIFQIAHYPVVADVYDFLPELISKIDTERGRDVAAEVVQRA